jgi:NADPH-dependent 2,4-dienoyl-CoA reductase/sulfur reductase-like enzyme
MTLPIGIVGGALAGGTAAATLRHTGYNGKLILISEEASADYDRPSLSKDVLCGKADTPPPVLEPDWIDNYNVEIVASQRAIRLDLHSGHLSLSGGSKIQLSKVLLCTGSRPRLPAIPGISLPGVFTLRTDKDSLAIRSSVAAGSKVVIIGGGLIGCEVATSLANSGCEITVVEAGPALLLRVLGNNIGRWMHGQLESLDIKVLLRENIAAIEGISSLKNVKLASGQKLPADLVLVAIGAEPNSELAAQAGLHCSGGILVDGCGATQSDMVFAAGDVASWPVRGGEKRSLETYLNSQAQAQIAAAALLGQTFPAEQVPYSWTEIAGHRLQMAGDISGPGEIKYRGALDEGPSVIFRVQNGKVGAVVAIDSPADFGVAKRMVDEQTALHTEELVDTSIRLRDIHKKNRKVVQ